MDEEHFDPLSKPHRDFISLGLGNIAGDLTGVFSSSRVILRASAFGQHFVFDGQAWRVCFRAWYSAMPMPVGFRFGSE